MIKKGIILAGGLGTRMSPITKSVNKQLLPIYDKPMIFYPLSILMLAGIKEILIIVNKGQVSQFRKVLKNGEHLGIKIQYKEQSQPNGLPEAFVIGEKFINNQNVALILGDNFFYAQSLTKTLQNSVKLKTGAKVFLHPVKNPKLPFLGVHFTKMINGNVEAGPNAVLALAREGYSWKIFNYEEFTESLFYPGLRNFIKKYPLITLGEISRSLSKNIFINSLRKLIPEIEGYMLEKGVAGVRAQLMNENGDLIEDFDIKIEQNIVSILNAPSPAATSSLALAKYIVNYLDL